MKKLCMILALALIPCLMVGCQDKEAFDHPTKSFAFTHVTLINTSESSTEEDMTVIVEGNCISIIGKTKQISLPKGVQVINATGKYLIPGLWDMHVHTEDTGFPAWDDPWFQENREQNKDIFFSLFIANGVTGIRDAGGEFPILQRWRKEIEQGKIIGPRMILPGKYITSGSQEYGYDPTTDILLTNEDDARRAVMEVKNSGADFIKIMAMPSEKVFIAFADEAKRQEIPFLGHAEGISVFVASEYGYASIEHLGAILAECADPLSKPPEDYYDNKPFLDAYNEQKGTLLFKHLSENNTRVCPTLMCYKRQNLKDIDTCDVRLKYMPAHFKTHAWFPSFRDMLKGKTQEDIADSKKNFEKYLRVIGHMHGAGVKLLAGTDTATPFNIPGFSLHEELILYTRAGLTPMEALQTATLNPAEFLGMQDSLGSIEEGKIADLVLLDADPLEDISNINIINSVVLNGKLLTRDDLDKILTKVEVLAGKK